MGSFVDFEIFASCENFPTSRKRTGEGFLPCMYSNMIDQFILGLEWSAMPGTVLPETGVVSLFWPPNMVHSQMVHDFMHRGEHFIARFLRCVLVFVYPQARVLLLDGLSHVPQESSGPVGPNVHGVKSPYWRDVERLGLSIVVRSLGYHVIVLLHTGINIGRESKSVGHVMSGGKRRGLLESGQ